MVAAVAKAAHDVLVSRFQIPVPNAALIAQVDAAYANYLINNGTCRVNDPGIVVGQQAAMNIIRPRANDGAFPANPEIFTGGTEPGEWRRRRRVRADGRAVDGQRDAVRAEGHGGPAARAGAAAPHQRCVHRTTTK